MDALLYVRFASAAQLQACLYYFDPATSLPFADEVEPEEAERIEAAEQLPAADAELYALGIYALNIYALKYPTGLAPAPAARPGAQRQVISSRHSRIETLWAGEP